MKLDRKKKIKKREERAKRHEAKLKADVTRIFEAMGVRLDVRRLPEPAQCILLKWCFSQPTVKVDFEDDSAERVEDIICAVHEALETTTFSSPGGHDISAPDFFRYCVSLCEATRLLVKRQWGGRFAAEIEDLKTRLDDFCERIIENEMHRILPAIDTALYPFTRLDSAIYWYTPVFQRNGIGKGLMTVTVHKKKAEMLRFTTERGSRPAYRVGGSLGLHGQYWSKVPRRLFGVDSDGYFPVYIQDHAILRLHERLPMPGWEGELHDCIWLSFIDPKLIVSPSGDKLVEYRFSDYKLGYFPVELIDDKVLIKTFLFITMTGTPEAKLLYKHCGLMRRDIEELSFDSLDTFHNTDVLEDQELGALLSRCGCGHLLDMINRDEPMELIRGRARQIRQYLGMKTI